MGSDAPQVSHPRPPSDHLPGLEYADAITRSEGDVDKVLFERVRRTFGDDAVVELTAVISWENSSSKFNLALRVPS